MNNLLRRKPIVNGPLSSSGNYNRTGTYHHSLPTHSAAPPSPPSPKEHRKRRIRTSKNVRSFKRFLSYRKFWIRVLLFSLFFWKRYALRRQSHRYLVKYLAWKADTVEGTFWRGTLPIRKWQRSNKTAIQDLNIDLVVSHCDLPLDWIFDWAKPITFDKITIISKCGKPVVGSPSNADIVVLPNLGRCDHSYAHFLLSHYDDFAEFDDRDGDGDDPKDKFIIFTKDNDNLNRATVSRHRSILEMIKVAENLGFACQEEQSWGYSLDHLFKICHLSAYMNWTAMAPYSRESYTRLPRDDNSEFASRNGKTFEEYIHNLNIPVPESKISPICFGGNFMFQAKYVRQNPKEMWERVVKSLSRGDNIAEGHYMERLWAHLLSPPLGNAQVLEILKQEDSSSCPIEGSRAGVFTK